VQTCSNESIARPHFKYKYIIERLKIFMRKFNKILPKSANNEYKGYNIAKYVFLFIILFTLARSCIHIFTLDGGAGIIAGLDITGETGQNLISLFAMWGLSQLLIGLFFIIVYMRYQNLISFCYLTLIIEYAGRITIGFFKPVISTNTPPGAIANFILVPLSIIMFILSVKVPKESDN
jgi:hypothetical protein